MRYFWLLLWTITIFAGAFIGVVVFEQFTTYIIGFVAGALSSTFLRLAGMKNNN